MSLLSTFHFIYKIFPTFQFLNCFCINLNCSYTNKCSLNKYYII
uniref:Uncharacterized protein n=1 Tax=Arundo donax TaxID=35708 RepID=A0A0A9B7V5_ARUDO